MYYEQSLKDIDELVALIRGVSDMKQYSLQAGPTKRVGGQVAVAIPNYRKNNDEPSKAIRQSSLLIRQLSAPGERKATRASSILSDTVTRQRSNVNSDFSLEGQEPNISQDGKGSRPQSNLDSKQDISITQITELTNAQRIAFGALLILELHGIPLLRVYIEPVPKTIAIS